MRRPMLRPTIAAALFNLCASSAHATSCAPLDDRYVFSCDAQRCIGEFRVDEVSAFGTCSRRPVVKSIDPQVASFLAALVAPPAPGVYTIKLPAQYWRTETDDGAFAALLDRMKERLVSYEDRQRVDLRSLSPAELRPMVEKSFGGDWLSKDAEHQTTVEARRSWESKAWRAQALAVSLWAAY